MTLAVSLLIPGPNVGLAACPADIPPPETSVVTVERLSLWIPDSLVVERSAPGRVVVYADGSKWLTLLDVTALPIARVNGYGTEWRNLEEYAAFVGAALDRTVLGDTQWEMLLSESTLTLLHVADGIFHQVSHTFLEMGAAFEPVVEEMIGSLCLAPGPLR